MLGGVHIASVSLVIPVVTAIILAFLLWMVHRTRVGMAMRAVSTDIEASRLMAIDVNRIVSITFAIGSALAAVGGILWALKYPRLEPLMGIMPGAQNALSRRLSAASAASAARYLAVLLLGVIELMTVALPT